MIHLHLPGSLQPALSAGAAGGARRIAPGREGVWIQPPPRDTMASAERGSRILDLILLAVGDRGAIATGASAEDVQRVRSMSAKGDGSADEVYRLYSERVFRFIYWRVGEQAEDAEDLVLETFMTAIDLAGSFDGRSSVFAWLCGIAKLRMIDLHRRRGRGKRSAGGQPLSLHDLDESAAPASNGGRGHAEELLDRINASQLAAVALQALTIDERESILLQHVDGLSVKEVAVHMKRSADAINSLTHRAKGKLRTALLTLMGEEDRVD